MLHFFRRYQRFIFLMITVVIVISFSFFGTYSTLSAPSAHEQLAFNAIDGTNVSRGELEQMAIFLGTDGNDKMLFGGMWGPNFLNDGVIKKDFLETGLAAILVENYQSDVKQELQQRLEKEKRYSPYINPDAKFLSAESAWGYFAPALKENFNFLRTSQQADNPAAVKARIKLFLAEKKFPSTALRQVLRYQEQQHKWISPDENLDRVDLSLFGYHTVEDWFGPRFVRLISQFVINAAKIAQQKGYYVSNEEALVDLMRNAETSYELNRVSPYLGVANSQEYFQEQLQRMNIDQSQAVTLWKQVLLFRRLFHEVGNAVFVDPFEYQKFAEYAKETAEGDLYRLPKSLHFPTYKDMQKFEVYLDAVAKREQPLALPTTFYAVQDVEKQYPELVQKRYLVEVAEYNKKNLQSKVGLKETWNWEVQNENWNTLQKQYPELETKKANTVEERLAALNSLDEKSRARIDTQARMAIVDKHPEWLKEALDLAKPTRMEVGFKGKDSRTIFVGLEDSATLTKLLDSAEMGENSAINDKLSSFTADNTNYYRIRVIDRANQKEILTFAEASRDGTLDKLLKKKLEAVYQQMRKSRPEEFSKGDNSWKELVEVQDVVADQAFAKTLAAIKTDDSAQSTETKPTNYTGDYYASHRLVGYVRGIKSAMESDPAKIAALSQEPKDKEISNKLAARQDLKDQWKLEKVPYRIDRSRSNKNETLPAVDALALSRDAWTSVYTFPNGEIAFFQLKEKRNLATAENIATRMESVKQLLSNDAQQILMNDLLREIKDKKAISFENLGASG